MSMKLYNDIIDLVGNYYKVDLLTKCRKPKYAEPRQMAMKLIRESNNAYEQQVPLEKIAKLFNKKQHGTVLSGIKRIDDLLLYEKKLKEDYDFLNNEVKKLKLFVY